MESNNLKRTITYKRKNRAQFLLFVPIILAPIFGFLLFASGWWMFFSCLLAYFIQIILWPFLVVGAKKKEVTINADEIERHVAKEKKFLYVQMGLLIFVAILDLFPLFSMSETFLGWISGREYYYVKTYEGGVLVTLLSLLMSGLFIVSVIMVQSETDLFAIRDKFQKTGLTPSEQSEKDRKIAIQKREDRIKDEKEMYGENYKIIDRNLKLYINEETQKIFMKGIEYSFSDILGFSVQDNAQTIHSSSTSIAKTNNGNMLGRAAVGGLVAGNLGAVIGGATASKTIETSGGTSTVMHDYSIIVTVNDLSSPMVTLKMGQDQNLMNRVSSTLTVIVNRNKK